MKGPKVALSMMTWRASESTSGMTNGVAAAAWLNLLATAAARADFMNALRDGPEAWFCDMSDLEVSALPREYVTDASSDIQARFLTSGDLVVKTSFLSSGTSKEKLPDKPLSYRYSALPVRECERSCIQAARKLSWRNAQGSIPVSKSAVKPIGRERPAP
jgi:hypothetical protein